MKNQTLTKNNSDVLELNEDTQLQSAPTSEEKKLLEECLDDLFSKEEQEDLQKEEQTPEVRFTRFLWKIKFIEQEIEKHKRVAEETINEINSWFEKKRNQLEKQIEWLSNQMENYLIIQNKKKLELPPGRIAFRSQQDKIEIIDNELFYNKALPELLRKIEESFEPDMSKIKKYIKETGDVPEGIAVSPQQPKFYIKLNNGGK